MQFTAAAFALIAALAMVEPSQASFIGKMLGGKRDVIFSRMEAAGVWARADVGVQQDFQSCMSAAHEVLKVSHVGVATSGIYKLSPQDGSWPAACTNSANDYIKTGKEVGGKLVKNADGSYDLTLTKAADKTAFDSLVAKTN